MGQELHHAILGMSITTICRVRLRNTSGYRYHELAGAGAVTNYVRAMLVMPQYIRYRSRHWRECRAYRKLKGEVFLGEPWFWSRANEPSS